MSRPGARFHHPPRMMARHEVAAYLRYLRTYNKGLRPADRLGGAAAA